MYFLTLTKIHSEHNNLRTEIVKGYTQELPVAGESFVIFNDEPLAEWANHRCVTTSVVKHVEWDSESSLVFVTQNSVYALNKIEKVGNYEHERND